MPAARLLREAVVKEPTSVTLHYYLAISATHLDLREEAVREFRWVLANAPQGSSEGEAARRWLVAAGALPAPATASAEPAEVDREIGDRFVRGQVSWPDGQPPVAITRMQLFLKGVPGTPTQDFQYVLRTDEEGRYEFKRIPPGDYSLSNRIAGEPLWRLRVKVPADQDVTLDLTPQNSFKIRDDFPQYGS